MSQNLDHLRQQAVDLLMQHKAVWEGTPEQFLVFVKMMELTTNPPLETESPHEDDSNYQQRESNLDKYAAVFLEMYEVDFSPYLNFTDLRQRANVNEMIMDVCKQSIEHLEGEGALMNAVETEGVSLNQETIENMFCSDILAEVFVNKLSKVMGG